MRSVITRSLRPSCPYRCDALTRVRADLDKYLHAYHAPFGSPTGISRHWLNPSRQAASSTLFAMLPSLSWRIMWKWGKPSRCASVTSKYRNDAEFFRTRLRKRVISGWISAHIFLNCSVSASVSQLSPGERSFRSWAAYKYLTRCMGAIVNVPNQLRVARLHSSTARAAHRRPRCRRHAEHVLHLTHISR